MRLLYIHIPRTGGRAITESGAGIDNVGHKYAEEVENINEYYSFCFVRNPYDRFMSSYYFYRDVYRGDRIIKTAIKEYESFEQFVYLFDTFECKHDLQFIPQHKFINESIDYVGRFELLQKEWFEVCKLSDNQYYDLRIVNHSKHKHWRYEYNQEMKDIVYELYKEDFNLLGYNK